MLCESRIWRCQRSFGADIHTSMRTSPHAPACTQRLCCYQRKLLNQFVCRLTRRQQHQQSDCDGIGVVVETMPLASMRWSFAKFKSPKPTAQRRRHPRNGGSLVRWGLESKWMDELMWTHTHILYIRVVYRIPGSLHSERYITFHARAVTRLGLELLILQNELKD